MACERTKYAVGVGAVGLTISVIAVIASVLDMMGRMVEIGTTLLATVLYFFGVVFLTSAGGPASTMGNMYFSVWGGCFVSFALLLGTLFPSANGDVEERGEGTSGTGNRYGDQEDNI